MIWPLGQMRRPIDWVQVAQFVEDHTSGFGQRLVTVTSQLLDTPEHRGSAQILDQLVADIERHTPAEGISTFSQRGRRCGRGECAPRLAPSSSF